MTTRGEKRPTWVEVNTAAIAANVATIRHVTQGAALCAVVKADGYGHGAVTAANAAIAGGAAGLAVALVDEGMELREAGVSSPILVLSEPPLDQLEACFSERLTPTIATFEGARRAIVEAKAVGGRNPVHLKVDTGMHRVGVAPADAIALAKELSAVASITLEGVFTHFSVADGASDDDRAFTVHQLDQFNGILGDLRTEGLSPAVRHAANSAGAISYPDSRLDMVRCGLAIYGFAPSRAVEEHLLRLTGKALAPALSLKAKVAATHRVRDGARPSYGRRRAVSGDATIATVPIGYADGFPRALFDAGCEVLIGGKRRPLAGTVTMDMILVDCGDDDVHVGDEVVLLGTQGNETITAGDWAAMLATITWEVLCGIGFRVPRIEVGSARG